jgi:hypothetical protein
MKLFAKLTQVILLSVLVLLSPTAGMADSRQISDRSAGPETNKQNEIKSKPAPQSQPRMSRPKIEEGAAPGLEAQTPAEVRQEKSIPGMEKSTLTKPDIKKQHQESMRMAPPHAQQVNKLEALKILRVYEQNDKLHVVLHYLGRERLEPKDFIAAELIVRQGFETDVVLLRTKLSQLRQLSSTTRKVDIDTGIKPKNELVRVSFKGQRDTYTVKIPIKHTGVIELPKNQAAAGTMTPLEVQKKEMAVGSMPAEEIDKVHTLKEPPGVHLNPNSPLWEISLDKVEVQTPHCSVGGSWYDLKNKYGPSCNDPKTVIYDHLKNKNEAIFVNVRSAFGEGSIFWFKVRAHIKIKSIPMDQMTDGQLAKWGQKAVGKWSLVVKTPFDGYLSKSETISTPTITRESIQERIEKNASLEYEITSTLEIENTFLQSNFHQAVEGNNAFRTQVVVFLDPTYAIDEIDEDNNRTRVPDLILKETGQGEPEWHVNLFRPDGNYTSDKWVIGSVQQIQWEESYINQHSPIVIKLVRTRKGVSQVVGTIANNIYPSSSPASVSFTEGYNQYDWHAGQLLSGSYAEPNIDDHGDYYWLKFFAKHGGSLHPLVVNNDARFNLYNFTKQFGNLPKKETMQTPDSMISPHPQ